MNVSSTTVAIVIFIAHPIGIAECNLGRNMKMIERHYSLFFIQGKIYQLCSQFYWWIIHLIFNFSKPIANILKQVPPTIVSSTTVTIVIFIAHPVGIAECYTAVVASIVTTKIASKIIDEIYQQTIYTRLPHLVRTRWMRKSIGT